MLQEYTKSGEISKNPRESVENEQNAEVNITELYNKFNNINPDTIEEYSRQGGIFPWKIVRSNPLEDISYTTLKVYLSDDFKYKYQLDSQTSEKPILVFHTNRYQNSYDKLTRPVTNLEVNTIYDSDIEGHFTYSHWNIAIDSDLSQIIESPGGLLTPGDLNAMLSMISQPITVYPSHEVTDHINATLDSLPPNTPLKDLKQIIETHLKNPLNPNSLMVLFEIELQKLRPYITSEHLKTLENLRIQLLQKSLNNEEILAKRFIDYTDLATKREKFNIIASIASSAVVTKIGLSISEHINQYSDNKADEEQTRNQLKIDRERVRNICKNLEHFGQHDLSDFYRNLYNISFKWGLRYNQIDNRFLTKLTEVKEIVEQIADGYPAENIDIIIQDKRTDEEVINQAEIFKESETGEVKSSIAKRFVKNIIKTIPFLLSVVLNNRIVCSESNDLYQQPFPRKVLIAYPGGNNWRNNIYDRVNLTIHELLHGFHYNSLKEIVRQMTIRDYIAYLNMQLRLSSDMLDDWLDNYPEITKVKEIYFGGWATNVVGGSYDYELIDEYIKVFPEYELWMIDTNESFITHYYARYQEEYRVNSFFFWALNRVRKITQKRQQMKDLSPKELDFLNRYYMLDLGNIGISHMIHQLEYILPYPEEKNKNRFRKSLLAFISHRLLKKHPNELILDLENNIFNKFQPSSDQDKTPK